MTIDETIKYHKKEAYECREMILKEKILEPQESYYCLCLDKGAEEHEQLARWLEELKEARKGFEENRKAGYKHGYSDAITEFAERFIYKAVCEGCSGCCGCYEEGKQSECEDWKSYMEIAEEMRCKE